MSKEIVDLAKSLVSFKTTENNLFEMDRCMDFIKSYFSGCNVVVRKFVCNKKPSLIVTMSDTKQPELFLLGHIDVVPADDSDFVPKIKKGKLFGRGSSDNKASVAIIMRLMKELSMQASRPSVGLMITSDEEVGGENGASFLLKEGFRSKFVIVPDGGRIDEIVIKEKGFIRLRVSAKGRAAHSAYLWEGENAIEKLIDAYRQIKRIFPNASAGSWKPTLNLGRISGGNAVNVVPSYAEMELDIRYTEHDSREGLLRKIRKIRDVSVEVGEQADVFETGAENRYVAALRACAQAQLKRKVDFSAEHGASDIRFFGRYKIPGVLIMPEGCNAHAANEYVSIESTQEFYGILKDFVNSAIGKEAT